MLYLSGVLRPTLRHPRLGFMVTPEMGQMPPSDTLWAADNGCFAHPDRFSMEKYQRFLDRALTLHGDRCLFAIAPDVPFDSDATRARFEVYGPTMKSIGAPVAYAAQNGTGVEDVPWTDIDALFIGGTTEWKTGGESGALIQAARERGLWVHMGRCNSLRRLQTARAMGCDSADGTYLKYGPDINEPKLLRWLETMERVRPMVLMG